MPTHHVPLLPSLQNAWAPKKSAWDSLASPVPRPKRHRSQALPQQQQEAEQEQKGGQELVQKDVKEQALGQEKVQEQMQVQERVQQLSGQRGGSVQGRQQQGEEEQGSSHKQAEGQHKGQDIQKQGHELQEAQGLQQRRRSSSPGPGPNAQPPDAEDQQGWKRQPSGDGAARLETPHPGSSIAGEVAQGQAPHKRRRKGRPTALRISVNAGPDSSEQQQQMQQKPGNQELQQQPALHDKEQQAQQQHLKEPVDPCDLLAVLPDTDDPEVMSAGLVAVATSMPDIFTDEVMARAQTVLVSSAGADAVLDPSSKAAYLWQQARMQYKWLRLWVRRGNWALVVQTVGRIAACLDDENWCSA